MSGESEHGDAELIEVIDAHQLQKPGTILHRLDDDKGCSNRPDTNTSTDLVTAAVLDGHELCSRCEWPEGAEEVITS